MKYLKIFTGSVLLYFLFFSTSTQLTSCQKETVYDTVIVKDTVTIRDTVDCDCYDLKDGLVAWYNFNGGNLNDSSGKNNHIVYNNASKTTDRFGKPNNAYLFNGTSSYMRVANSASINPTSAITLTAVVKLNDFYRGECHGNQILGKINFTEYSNGYYALRISDQVCNVPVNMDREKFSGAYGDNQNGGPHALTDTTFAKTGQWYNIVYTYENGHSKIYINGELKGARDFASPFTPNAADVYIGKNDNSQYPYLFNGVIDDIRIYNRALCYGEVKQLNRSKD